MSTPTASPVSSPIASPAASASCGIVELRQYTLHPGSRDAMITLFDREFVETQEAVGMTIIGQFRDLDDPNRFVWLRGFPDMAARGEALTAFYVHGEAWKTHRAAARATMVDTTNALLLRPAQPDSGFKLPPASQRPGPQAEQRPQSIVMAEICYLDAPAANDFVTAAEQVVRSKLVDAGARLLACLVTEASENTFPALPVREGEYVFIWFASFPNTETCKALPPAALLEDRPIIRSERLRLAPTARSLLV